MVSKAVSVKRLLLCAAWGGVIVYAAFQAARHQRTLALSPPRQEVESAMILETEPPLRIQPLVRGLFAADSEEAAVVSRVFREHPRLPLNVSYCCHLLRLYGLKPFRHPVFTSGSEVVSVLTDQKLSKEYFGEPIFFRTRSGIRYEDSIDHEDLTGENHRDICLASLAELGLPLSTPMVMEKSSFTLADLLRDSVENFDVKQRELPWTAVAYGIYLHQRQWSNRYGESFTFDDVADELMNTPFGDASCGGTHLLYALTVLLRTTGLLLNI